MSPLVGVSWMPTAGFRAAVEPMLARVEAVEWTVDTELEGPLPPSTLAVLEAFGQAGRLFAHTTGGSLFSAGREDAFAGFLAGLRRVRRPWVDLSDHVGASAAGPLRFGAPLPVPPGPATLRVGRERLARLAEAAGCPAGLENLALAFSRADALRQGPMVAELLEGGDGFVHLDLHNLWCQVVNFDLDPRDLLATWPLERVRRLHVSGGSWQGPLRRDTHDHRVPEEVWDLLREALPRVPGCRAVVLEQLPEALATAEARAGFRADLERLLALRDEVCGVG